ncbi:dynamin family protein [Campylobacter sp. MG1]|uniref:dynamin family protein n=1 Tax=Campylobacter sp. MG1 TaxID=2976332 RepID=UPI00226CBF70|nr:dynamin family protein [Campylobacter sp. MG1]
MQELLQNLWKDLLGNLDYNYEKNIFSNEFAALVLTANEANYKELLSLKTYTTYLQINNFYELKKLQIGVLNSIKNNLLDPKEILFHLEKLKNIVKNETIFNYLKEQNGTNSNKFNNEFDKTKNKLNEIFNELNNLLSDDLKKQVQEFKNQLETKDFKIAFSGIFNAGKSSLINSLLDSNFLGVSNAPETANLSIINYSNNPCVKVNFYDEKEFNTIKSQASLNEELSEYFKIDYKKFESINIELKDLYNYTSANSNMSIFVKDIEININNEYLKNNISIIDTPGLDDIVISREQKSLEFLKKANCILYLMSATQALSIKDLEFLCNFMKNNPTTKLILVLTKSDLVSQSELFKLKDYVQNRFKNELLKHNITTPFYLFSVSANEYQNNKNNGNINSLRMFLNENIFNSSNTKEFTNNIKEKIKNIISNEILNLENINNSLKLDDNNYKQKIDELKEKARLQNERKILNFELLKEYENKKYELQEHELKFLAKIQANKIFDELNYNKNYSNEQAKNIIMQGFKDCLSGNYSSLKHNFMNDFDEICKKIEINSDIVFEFNNKKLQENYDNLDRVLNTFNILSTKVENDIQEKLNAIYTNLNYDIFKFIKQKNTADDYLKSTLNSMYTITHIPENISDASLILEKNTKIIEQLTQLKKALDD